MRDASSTTSPLRTLLCGLIVFLSGTASLTYEIVWQREMFHLFGASARATAAILTAIFLGIAFGSLLIRSLAATSQRPLLLLAVLEGTIGVWGLLVPRLLTMSEGLYVSTAHRIGEDSPWLTLARYAFAIIPLLPATLCMGATIPVMVKAFGRAGSASVSWIYGWNILGAVTGSLSTGLVWIRLLGQQETAGVAVAMNAVIVVGCLWLSRQRGHAFTAPPPDASRADSVVAVRARIPTPAMLYFVAGFVALGLEVVWLRYLGIVNSNSSVTFSLTLAFYLSGMGVGSLFVYPALRRRASPESVFSVANAGVVVASLLTFPVIYWAPHLNQAGIDLPSAAGELTLSKLYRTEAWIVFLLLFAPTIFMGLVYPAVCDCLEGPTERRQRWIGQSYFFGTLGSVAGIIGISLFVIPQLGLHGTFALLVTLSGALCVISLGQPLPAVRRRVLTVLMVGCSAFAWYQAWDPQPVLRNTIARKVGDRWMERTPDGKATQTEIVRFQAGASGTAITKFESETDDYFVYVDDQLVASTNIEARVDAVMLAHLPLLLHPQPTSELTVGFGTGGTSYAITTHGVQAYCAEIEPEVPAAAHLLVGQNYGILDRDDFHLILNDARDHLHITQRQYDVIATDVTNLQYKQNSSLYTVEYFQLMKDRMPDDGVACAWIPMAAIATDELRILMKSFQHVFPHATLWFMNHTHTNFGILIGTPERLQIDYRRFAAAFEIPKVKDSLQQIGLVHPMQLVTCLQLDEDGYRTFCGDLPLHTDNRPTLEFSSPLSFYQYNETFCDNMVVQLKLRPVDFRPLVIHGPAADDPVWESHRVAAQAGCDVILGMYQFQTLWRRRQAEAATSVLIRSMQAAEAGMAAWPEDATRERLYVDFFDDANRRLQSRLPGN
ncbi:MAG: hypothetical protein NXI04_00715 [Planctomycetaceae bacterium]|nr:hypothetical protein [Planctomycetaceae bacterium]